MKPGLPKGSRQGADNPNWKGEQAVDRSKRGRAARALPVLGACARCGEQATGRHHKDGNLNNNTLDNLVPLCQPCHMHLHWQQGDMAAVTPPQRLVVPATPHPCSNCGRTVLRATLCPACSTYKSRHGGANRPTDGSVKAGNNKGRLDLPTEQIMTLYETKAMNMPQLAKHYGCSLATIWGVIHGKRGL